MSAAQPGPDSAPQYDAVLTLDAAGIAAARATGDGLPTLIAMLDPVNGGGALYTQPSLGLPRYNLAVVFTSDPWVDDGLQPIAWYWSTVPLPTANPLLIVAARDVELTIHRATPAGKGSMAVPTSRDRRIAAAMTTLPAVEVARLESRDLVPPPGQWFSLEQVRGEPSHNIGGVSADWPPATETGGIQGTAEPQEDWLGSLTDAYALFVDLVRRYRADHVVVRPTTSGVTLAHANEDWVVDIRHATGRSRGGFTYEIVSPAPDRQYGHVEVRVVHTADVEVSATEVRSLFTLGVRSTVTVRAHRVELDELPATGAPLGADAHPWTTSVNDWRPSPFASAVIELTVVGASLIPVVGTVIDVAHLAYMYAYGRTFWQETVTEGQLFLEGVFVLTGVVIDVGAVGRLRRVFDELFPKAGAPLLSPNPGLVTDLRWTVDVAVGPVMRHTLDDVGQDGADRLVRSLERHALDGEPLEVVARAVDEVIYQPYRAALDADLIPDTLHQQAWSHIHPSQIDGYDALDPASQSELLDLTVDIATGPRPVAAAVALVDELTPAMRAQYGALLDGWRMTRVFNVYATGFTSRRLAELYAEYVRKKVRAGLTYANPVQWAASPSRRTGRAHEELRRLLGGSYKKVIRDHAGELYYEVTDEVAEAFGDVAGVPRTYADQTQLNPNGRVFEADHIVEKRIHKVYESYFSGQGVGHELRTDDYQSLLVPKNAPVARQLRRGGLSFYYVHQYKTRLMQILVPHGTELAHTVQELFDAHVIVLRHQLDLPRDMVQSVALEEFRHLGDVLSRTGIPRQQVTVADTSWMTLDGLLRRHPKFAARLAATPAPPAP